jgi:DNA-binding beta-propeller fold protein YncE
MSIQKFDSKGQYLAHVGADLGRPNNDNKLNISLDATGSLYVLSILNDGPSAIHKYGPSGQPMARWGAGMPGAVAQDAAGNIYVGDRQSSQVVKYNALGQILMQFGSPGTEDDQFVMIHDLAVDRNGNIYVLDNTASRVQVKKFNPLGQFLKKYDSFGPDAGSANLTALALDQQGNLYLADHTNGCVRKLNPEGQLIAKFGSIGGQFGQLYAPVGVGLDPDGNIYVLDLQNRIQKFTASGLIVAEFGIFNRDITTVMDHEFTKTLAVDGKSYIYVGSESIGTVQIYDPEGIPAGKISQPAHRVAVNKEGTKVVLIESKAEAVMVYITDDFALENKITGNVFEDRNFTCEQDPGEAGIPGIVVVAEPGPYYGLTDESGRYSIAVDKGAYTVRQLLPQQTGRSISQLCPVFSPTHSVSFASSGHTATGLDFGNRVTALPLPLRIWSPPTAAGAASPTPPPSPTATPALPPPATRRCGCSCRSMSSSSRPACRTRKRPTAPTPSPSGHLQPNQFGTITIQRLRLLRRP